MSKLIKLAISAALLTATSVNAAPESPKIFPNDGKTMAAYRTISISRFAEMKAVREAVKEIEAQGYILDGEPTATLLSADCARQVGFCRPTYLVTQGAILGQETIFPQTTVLGAVISPTHFGSEDRMVPTDRMIQLPSLLRGTE